MNQGKEAARIARTWLGTPYRHQSATCQAGCDCLGLVRGVWAGLFGSEDFHVPAYSADPRRNADPGALERAAQTLLVQRTGSPETGDVLLFRLHRAFPPHHCGILIAPGVFVHAQERVGVIETGLRGAWMRRFAGAYAFPPPHSNLH